ncbi:DUF5343 domain-containing protein [Kribbella sp. NPDC026596]|uniref:DUF5343 domain-containing protein n=1 Tax=Kribbella sp. NPDC026596 TaxID=3155122 RepID=UPI0033C7680A
MADSPTAYPKVPAKAWRALQERASSAPSVKFSPQYVASLLDLGSPDSARANVVNPMRRLGLIDDDGGLTDRGRKWRVKESYGAACQEILDEVYPDDLASLTDNAGAIDVTKIQSWFEHSGLGTSNARQMAATYAMIAKKQLPEAGSAEANSQSGQRARSEPRKAKKATVQPPKPTETTVHEHGSNPGEGVGGGDGHHLPKVHLDIQIHIPADATPEQIDQIFASMGKHLYGR